MVAQDWVRYPTRQRNRVPFIKFITLALTSCEFWCQRAVTHTSRMHSSKIAGCFDPFGPTSRPMTSFSIHPMTSFSIHHCGVVPRSATEPERNLPKDFKHPDLSAIGEPVARRRHYGPRVGTLAKWEV